MSPEILLSMDVLLDLDIKGLPNAEYVFLNVENGIYLYHQRMKHSR